VSAAPAPEASSGPFTVSGRAPAAVSNVPSIVIFDPETAIDSPQGSPPFMDQVQQTFIPPILIVRTGQPSEFLNNDDVLHNVRVREAATHQPAFNVAIPTGEKYVFTFARDGFYDVGCDIHPGMAAQVVATRSPYAAVADPAGNFFIEGVPAGTYKVTVYTGSERVDHSIAVAAGATTIDLTARP
jgi:plastocyanin